LLGLGELHAIISSFVSVLYERQSTLKGLATTANSVSEGQVTRYGAIATAPGGWYPNRLYKPDNAFA